MVNAPRRKGTRAESQMVQWFHDVGETQVERHSLHGTADIGDLQGVPGLVVSIKFVGQGKPMDLSGWCNRLQEMRDNAKARLPELERPDGLLIVRRAGYPPGRWYAVEEVQDWWGRYADAFLT